MAALTLQTHGLPAMVAVVVFATVTLVQKRIVPADSLPVFVAIALFLVGVIAITRYDSFLRNDRLRASAFTFIALVVLASSSAVYLFLLQGRPVPTEAYAWYGRERFGELARVSREHRYWMDGALDEWVFVLFKQGLFALSYDRIPVQEKGLLYFYAALMRLAGDFNTYLLVVANCAAQVVSSWLVLRIAVRFAPPRAALGAAALLLVMPDSLYWGSMVHKDNFVVCLVLLCLWSALKAFDAQSPLWIYSVPFAGSLIALAFVRSGLVVPLIFGGLLAIALSRKSVVERVARYTAAVILGIVLVTTILPDPVVKELQFNAFERVYYRLTKGSSYMLDVENIRFRTTAEDSLVYRLSGGDLNLRKLHYVPVRVAMYFIAPFPPWPMRTQLDYFILLSTWMLIPLWFLFVKGCWNGLRQGDNGMLWALAFFLVIAIAVAFAGGFVLERYRLVLMPFFLSFASFGESQSTGRQKLMLLGASLCTFLVGLMLYWTLK